MSGSDAPRPLLTGLSFRKNPNSLLYLSKSWITSLDAVLFVEKVPVQLVFEMLNMTCTCVFTGGCLRTSQPLYSAVNN